MSHARTALAEAMSAHAAARSAADKAATDVERVERALALAVEQIDAALEGARSARAARQDARAAALARGETGLNETDSELSGREREQLAALSDAKVERRAAEQVLPQLRTAARESREALRVAEERFTDATRQVLIEQVEHMTRKRLEELAAEFSELTRWRAAACEIGVKVAPPPRIQFQFAPEHMRDEMAALKDFRHRLETDPGAAFNV